MKNKIIVILLISVLTVTFIISSCSPLIIDNNSRVVESTPPPVVIKPFPVFDKDTSWTGATAGLEPDDKKQYPMPPIVGNELLTTRMKLSALVQNILDNNFPTAYRYFNTKLTNLHDLTSCRNDYNNDKNKYISYIIDDILDNRRIYPYETIPHSERIYYWRWVIVPPFFGFAYLDSYVRHWNTYRPMYESPWWDIVDNSIKYELFLDKYYYLNPAIGITTPVATQISNKTLAPIQNGSSSDYRSYVLNNLDINLSYKMPQYVIPDNVPTAGNFTHDLGFISPVVIKKDGKYILWTTRLSKIYNSNTNISINKCYRSFYYNYELYCYESPDGASWVEADPKYLNGFTQNIFNEEKGGRIITDIKQLPGGGRWYIFYLARDTTSDNDLNWKMYIGYSVNSDPSEWLRSQNGMLMEVLKNTTTKFDTASKGKGSVICNSNNDFQMWYAGDTGKKQQIGYAISRSILTDWTPSLGGEPVIKRTQYKFDGVHASDPTVAKEDTSEGTVYKLFYSGYDGNKWRLGLTYTWDGEKFKYHNDTHTPLAIGVNDVRYPYVLKESNNNYMLWYSEREKVYPDTLNGKSIIYDDPQDYNVWKIKMVKTQ